MEAETQARVWAAANDARLRAAVQRTSGLSKGEWICETCRVILWEGADHVVSGAKCLGPPPDLLTWAGCGALLEAMRVKGWSCWMETDIAEKVIEGVMGDSPAVARFYHRSQKGQPPDFVRGERLPECVARAAAAALGVEEGRA